MASSRFSLVRSFVVNSGAEAVDFLPILLIVLASRSRGMRPTRMAPQASRRREAFNRGIAKKSTAHGLRNEIYLSSNALLPLIFKEKSTRPLVIANKVEQSREQMDIGNILI